MTAPETFCADTAREAPRRRSFCSRPRIIRRFRNDADGAAAVEFAFVAIPFFALVFAIIELSLIFFGGQMLETATADSARLVLTGQQQDADSLPNANGTPQTTAQKMAAFKKSLCDPSKGSMLKALFDCTKLIVDVRCYGTSFSGLDMATPIVNGQLDPSFTPAYQPGGVTDVTVVRVMYPWDTWVVNWPYRIAGIFMNFSNMSGNKRMLIASAAFRNEPYGPEPTTRCTP